MSLSAYIWYYSEGQFRIVSSLTPYDLPFPQMEVPNAPAGLTSRRMLPPGEYDNDIDKISFAWYDTPIERCLLLPNDFGSRRFIVPHAEHIWRLDNSSVIEATIPRLPCSVDLVDQRWLRHAGIDQSRVGLGRERKAVERRVVYDPVDEQQRLVGMTLVRPWSAVVNLVQVLGWLLKLVCRQTHWINKTRMRSRAIGFSLQEKTIRFSSTTGPYIIPLDTRHAFWVPACRFYLYRFLCDFICLYLIVLL